MKPLAAILVLLAGAGLGWGACWFLGEKVDPAATERVAQGEDTAGGAPRLRGTSAWSFWLTARADTDPALREAVAGALAGGGEAALLASAGADGSSASYDARGWQALLTLYALAGRTDDFLRIAPKALAAGVDGSDVVDLLRLLPADRQADALEHLLEAFPDLAWPLGDVADVLVAAGRADRAVALLVPALESNPDRHLVASLVRADPERAGRILTGLARKGDWSPDLLEDVGDAFVASERPDLAVAFYESGLAKEPLDRSLLDRLEAASPGRALAHVRRLTLEHAADPKLWQRLGELQLATGDASGAFEAYRRAASQSLTKESLYGMLRADPERAFAAARDLVGPESDDEMLGALARLALASGETSETLDVLQRAHERDPSDHEWNRALVALDARRAAQLLKASAETYRGENRDEVIGAYGTALLELGQTSEAFARYREAYELDPRDGEWQRGLARADPRQAVALLEARRREAGDDADLLGALADAYAGAGRREEARALYEQAVAAGGGLEWYGRMALVDPDGARAHLQQETTSNPDSDRAWGALGEYHRLLGNTEAAREAYARARTLAPSNLEWEMRWRSLSR